MESLGGGGNDLTVWSEEEKVRWPGHHHGGAICWLGTWALRMTVFHSEHGGSSFPVKSQSWHMGQSLGYPGLRAQTLKPTLSES